MADETQLHTPTDTEQRSRLAGDEALYARLVQVGFTGPDYQAVADALARYAYPILYAWLASGQIVQECARRGIGGIRRLAAGEVTLTRHDIDDLVQDTLITALARFQKAGQDGHGWSPQGGAALRSYFVSGCVLAFGTAYQRWEHHYSPPAQPLDPDTTLHRSPLTRDPADLVALGETLTEALPPPGSARTAVLLNAAGYSHDEIARILGEDVTSRAVEGLLYRHRNRLKGGPRS